MDTVQSAQNMGVITVKFKPGMTPEQKRALISITGYDVREGEDLTLNSAHIDIPPDESLACLELLSATEGISGAEFKKPV